MTPDAVRALLAQVAAGAVDVDAATEQLRHLPFEDLDFARVDHHRELRQGSPEVIFAAGKTPAQTARIAQAIVERGSNLLITRAGAEAFAAVEALVPGALFHAAAGVIVYAPSAPVRLGRVAIACAGTSDLPVADEAALCCEFFGAEVVRFTDVGVAGLHRLAAVREELEAADAVIVVAGMEGALPSVVGGLVSTPVVAVPTSVGYGASFGGIAALLGMLNSCAAGVTVVNIDNGFGAAAAVHRVLRATDRAAKGSAA